MAVEDQVLLVDKPAGVTSHDVVADERRRLGRGVKVGHAGTLDPFATGLLLLLIGRATRAQRFLMVLPKRYEAVARLGWTSSTGDPEGEIAPGRVPPEPLVLPTGRLRQRPHAYSAVKVSGKRAYALARAGEAVELEEREVTVSAFELLRREEDRATFAVECSAGTYVRSLVADLGDAYCLALRRTAIGPYRVEEAGRRLGLDDALGFLPAVVLEGDVARRAAHGVAVQAPAGALAASSSAAPAGALAASSSAALPASSSAPAVRLRDADGLIALAEPRPDGTLKPVVGFRG